MLRRNQPVASPCWSEMLRHALPAGEQIAEEAEHGAEIDRHQPGLVLEDDVLPGDEAGLTRPMALPSRRTGRPRTGEAPGSPISAMTVAGSGVRNG